MKILNISTHSSGGAGQSALFFHNSLLLASVESYFLTTQIPKIETKNVLIYHFHKSFVASISYFIHKLVSKYIVNKSYNFKIDLNKDQVSVAEIGRLVAIRPDIIVLHWVSDFLNTSLIVQLFKYYQVPIVWRVNDMNAITGGCHYAFGCEKYKSSCHRCPALLPSNWLDVAKIQHAHKRNVFKNIDIRIIASCLMIENQINKSSLFLNKPIYFIGISIDRTIFKYQDKLTIRSKYEINSLKKVIFFGSTDLTDSRKGMIYLIETLKILAQKQRISKDNILLVYAGKEIISSELPFESLFLGYIKYTKILAQVYAMSDLFVCPSIEDSGPIMIAESIACGTPVVSFEMGLALDFVISGKTGYSVPLRNIELLAERIEDVILMDTNAHKEISDNCIRLANEKLNPETEISQYVTLFHTIKKHG